MKRIHIIPIDKPSRIRIGENGNLVIGLTQSATISKNDSYTNQHIYITSDEEIKEGDYCISNLNIIDEGKIHNSQTVFNPKTKENLILLKSCKKIILTTDQDLINNRVQSIGDEFLEWFVKNPSCEEVEVESWQPYAEFDLDYKIIIPKEEPKQEIIEEVSKDFYPNENELMERIAFKRGYTECKERMYREEEVQVKLYECLGHFAQKHNIIINGSEIDQWFKQFKKK